MWRGGGSSMFRFPPVEWNPAVAWCVAPRSKRSRALRSRRGVTAPWQPRGVGVVIQPRRGVVLPPQPPPFLAGLIWVGACFRQTSVVFFPSVSPGGGLLTSGHKAPPRAAVQWGGFMAPWPRCCFCFCCRRSCSSAEGPGCIMELDQMDCGGRQRVSVRLNPAEVAQREKTSASQTINTTHFFSGVWTCGPGVTLRLSSSTVEDDSSIGESWLVQELPVDPAWCQLLSDAEEAVVGR